MPCLSPKEKLLLFDSVSLKNCLSFLFLMNMVPPYFVITHCLQDVCWNFLYFFYCYSTFSYRKECFKQPTSKKVNASQCVP